MNRGQSSVGGARGQRGNAVIAALIGIAIVGALAVAWLRLAEQQRQDDMAKDAGRSVAQFAVGLRGFVSAVQANNGLAFASPRVGVDWLKPPACGGLPTNPVVGFLPCNYRAGGIGKDFSSTVTVDPTTNVVEARMNYLVPAGRDQGSRVAAAREVALQARANQVSGSGTSFFQAWANVPVTATAPASPTVAPGADAGRVLLVINNAPSNDVWLRTDGTNRMLANLNMGGNSIGNARDGAFAGNVRVSQALQVDQGLTVTTGSADLRGGVVTTDVAMTDIGVFASQGIYAAEVLTGATTYQIAKPRCSATASVPKIFASLQATGTTNVDGYQADSIYSSRVDVTDIGGAWQVTPVVIGTRFDMAVSGSTITLNKSNPTITPRDARIVVLRKCS